MAAEKQDPHDAEYWSSRSNTYEQSWMQKVIHDRIHRTVLDLVAAHGTPGVIVDIGCGTGRLLRQAGARWPGAKRIGVDAASGMIAIARQRTPGATFHEGPAESLPLPDASADVIVSTISFHHWPDQQQGVREVARVLRPGGRFYLGEVIPPLGLPLVSRHMRSNSRDRFRKLMQGAGLRVVGEKYRLGIWLQVVIGERG